MPYLEAPDCKLFYTIDDHTDPWARPDTILFVHGFTECTEAWRAWVPHFSRRYRVVRIDQRGFGQSEAVPKDFPLTTALFVDDLARAIRHIADGPVHVVGGKSGGISVLMLAATRPELAKTITVSCSPVTPPRAEGWQKTIPDSELAILPIDGYHAAGTDPDMTARVTLNSIGRHSRAPGDAVAR